MTSKFKVGDKVRVTKASKYEGVWFNDFIGEVFEIIGFIPKTSYGCLREIPDYYEVGRTLSGPCYITEKYIELVEEESHMEVKMTTSDGYVYYYRNEEDYHRAVFKGSVMRDQLAHTIINTRTNEIVKMRGSLEDLLDNAFRPDTEVSIKTSKSN